MSLNSLLDFLTEPRSEYKFRPTSITELVSEENGNRISITGRQIFLKLATEAKMRKIGLIDTKNETIWIMRTREKHLHRVSSSYGFNYRLFKDLPELKNVILEDEHDRFDIPVEVIRKGKLMNFKDSADGNEYELQFFIQLSVLKRYSNKK